MSEVIVQQVEDLQATQEFNKIFDILTEAIKTYPDDVELLWRYARAYYEKHDNTTVMAEKKEYLQKALDCINKAMTINPDHWACHKWWAITTSSMGDHIPQKEKIANAFKIKEHALKANELKPKDPVTLHLLGRWCYTISSISFIERGIASALFGTPPTSTYDEALKYLLESDENNDKNIRNVFFIGETYTQLKNQAKAKEYYLRASKMSPNNEIEKKTVEEALKKSK
eukprot:gene2778-3452_t